MSDDWVYRIRDRPGVYVGWPNKRGVLALVRFVIDGVLEEHLAGRCGRAHVAVADDDTITIDTDAPGIALFERITGAGSIGDSLSVVNALSERFEARVVRERAERRVVYRRGAVHEKLATAQTDAAPGTWISFRPDPSIFSTTRIGRLDLSRELENLSFLAPRFELSWSFAAGQLADRGLAGLVMQELGTPLGPVAHRREQVGDVDVEIAIGWQWDQAPAASPPIVRGFINFAQTETGAHIGGVLDAIKKAMPEGATRGLVAAVSVHGKEDVTKALRGAVARVARAALGEWGAQHPDAIARVREQAHIGARRKRASTAPRGRAAPRSRARG